MRLIDGDKLTHDLTDWQMELYSGKGFEREYDVVRKVINGISTTPTIDAVSVVRCKDCCYWDRETVRQNSNDAGWWNEAICRQHSVDGNEPHEMWTDADWFCADGERREG